MSSMYANELDTPAPLAERPLQWRTAPKPEPAEGQILIEVAGCGVCRSNLHMIEGEWIEEGVPAISPIVAVLGAGVTDFAIGGRSNPENLTLDARSRSKSGSEPHLE